MGWMGPGYLGKRKPHISPTCLMCDAPLLAQFSDDMMYRERYLLGQEYGGVVERHRATGFRPQGSLPDPDEVDRMISSNTPLVSGTQLRPQVRLSYRALRRGPKTLSIFDKID